MFESTSNKTQAFDYSAITLSGLCAFHCTVLPLLAISSPLIAQRFGLSGTSSHVHLWGLLIALPISCVALYQGYKIHQSHWIWVWASLGFSGMFAGLLHFSFTLQTVLTVIGVCLVATAHIINLRYRLRCSYSVRSS